MTARVCLRTVPGVAVCCLWLTAAPAFAVETFGMRQDFRITQWKSEDDLPQNSVQSILQTRDGYLWVGTYFGLARFDGVKFTVFDAANSSNMVNEACAALVEDQEGNLWIGTAEGLLRYRHGRFERFTTKDGLAGDSIWQLLATRDGSVWYSTRHDFGRWFNGRFRNYGTNDGLSSSRIYAVNIETSGLVVSVTNGIKLFDPATDRFIDPPSPRVPDKRIASALLEDKSGDLWAGFGGESGELAFCGLSRCHQGVWRNFTQADGLIDLNVEQLFETRGGELWVLTQPGGLHRWNGERFVPVPLPTLSPRDFCLRLHEDREGNLWVGTLSDGLLRLQPRRLKVFSARDGLAADNTWSVSGRPDGAMWVATEAGLGCIQSNRVVAFAGIEPTPRRRVNTVFEDRHGNVWMGRVIDGLFRLNGGEFQNWNSQFSLPTNEVHVITEDRAGTLWVGGRVGARSYRDGVLRAYSTTNGLSTNDVRAILEDRQGAMWFGTYGGGVHRLQDGVFTVFTEAQGLSNDFAWALHEDADGALWIGTKHGLNRFKNGRFSRFTKAQGLFDDLVNHMLEDSSGYFWISCNRGIYKVRRSELDDVAEGRARTVRYVAYGEADGMLASETNGEHQPAGWKSSDGRLWFPTMKGVVVIDPALMTDNAVEPPMAINLVRADGEVIYNNGWPAQPPRGGKPESSDDASRPIQLPAGRARVLEIQYTANSFVDSSKVRFKYCLDGYDPDWVEAGTRRQAFYTNLRPGAYQFRVKACNNHGRWNDIPAAFAFSLAPHYYQTPAFYVTCGVAVLAGFYGLHRLRVGVLTKIQQLQKAHALDVERGRIAREMHDDLGASLTQISYLSELAARDLARPEAAAPHLEKITGTTRSLFRGLREMVWVTNPRHDTVEGLVTFIAKYAQDFLKPARVQCRLDLPAELPDSAVPGSVRHQMFLAVKEALHNVVKHAGASEVRLRVQVARGEVQIRIEDNGRGFANGEAPGPTPNADVTIHPPELAGHGNGLLNMRHRLEEIGGHFELHSQPGQGTTVTLSARF